MTMVINEKYAAYRNPIKSFYVSRALRIFPLYFLVLAFAAVFFRSISQPSIFSNQLELSFVERFFLITSNVVIFGQDIYNCLIEDKRYGGPLSHWIGPLLNSTGLSRLQSNPVYFLIGQAWSVSIELLFYAFAPFLVTCRRRVLIFFGITLLLRFLALAQGIPAVPYSIRFFPMVLPLFLLGSLSYFLYRHASKHELSRRVGQLIFFAAITIYAAYAFQFNGQVFFHGGNFDTWSHWILYILVAAGIPFVFIFTKNLSIDNQLGEFSYPIYLVHGLILGYMVEPVKSLGISGPTLVIVWSLFFSWLLIRSVERPLDDFRSNLR